MVTVQGICAAIEVVAAGSTSDPSHREWGADWECQGRLLRGGVIGETGWAVVASEEGEMDQHGQRG